MVRCRATVDFRGGGVHESYKSILTYFDANVVSDAGNFRTVEEAIRHHADKLGAGLIVMGAYSHSWFREYIIGGVTREIVSDPPVPVLLAH